MSVLGGNPVISFISDGDGAFADLLENDSDADKVIHHGLKFTVAYLEKGMESGAASLMLRVDTEKGVVLVETSVAAWNAVTAAIRGRGER